MVQPIAPDYGQQFLLPPALEDWVAMVEVRDDIEEAVREAKELIAHE